MPDNIITPREYMEVKVKFYGVLAEVTGTRIKTYNTVNSFGDLRLRIRDDFPELEHYNFRFCVNRIFVYGEPVLSDGDEVALLPPFYGG